MMTTPMVKQKLDKCIRKALELNESTSIGWTTRLVEDLKADSLGIVQLGFEIEEVFGIDDDNLFDAFDQDITVRDIALKIINPQMETKELEEQRIKGGEKSNDYYD